jgi:hypothetical protein
MRATFRSSRRAAKRSTSSCSNFRSQCERPPACVKSEAYCADITCRSADYASLFAQRRALSGW